MPSVVHTLGSWKYDSQRSNRLVQTYIDKTGLLQALGEDIQMRKVHVKL